MYMEMNPPPVDLIRVPAFLGNGHSEIEFIVHVLNPFTNDVEVGAGLYRNY